MTKYSFTTGLIQYEYDKGYNAYELGQLYKSNPNERNSAEWYSWAKGWLDAKYLNTKGEQEK